MFIVLGSVSLKSQSMYECSLTRILVNLLLAPFFLFLHMFCFPRSKTQISADIFRGKYLIYIVEEDEESFSFRRIALLRSCIPQ